tara:strand:+ start:789 stop:1979 length:1191 start_codon:yes stop_codon:yes gene_type:complete
MPIKISAESLSAIKLGASDLTAAYLGVTRVFPNDITVSYIAPTGQSLTYTTPTTTIGSPGGVYSQTFTITGSSTQLLAAGSFAVAGLPAGLTASITNTGSGLGNTLTATISGVYPATPALNIAMVISGVTIDTYTQYTINYDSTGFGPSQGTLSEQCTGGSSLNTLSYSVSVANAIDVTTGSGTQTGYVPSFPQTVTYTLGSNTANAGVVDVVFIFTSNGVNCDICSLYGNNAGAGGVYQLTTTGSLTGGATLYSGATSRSWFLSLTAGGTSTIASAINAIYGQGNGMYFTSPAANTVRPTSIAIGQNTSSGGFFTGICNKTFTATATNGVRLFFQSIQTNPPDNYASSQTIAFAGDPFSNLIFDYSLAPATGTFTLTITCSSPVYSTVTRTFNLA